MIKVAIVENDQHQRWALERLFEHSDLFTLRGCYQSGEEALPNLLAQQPDIVLVGISLSGIALIKALVDRTPHMQFLICTSHQDNYHIFEALNAGAAGYILKGSTENEIRSAVKDVFMGGSPLSPLVARKIINSFKKSPATINEYNLSSREFEVLRLMIGGLLNKEIASKLTISNNTVKNHLKKIYKKLDAQNKIEVINKCQYLLQ
jgi:NarL family two-component system response regulator LiaR